MVDKAEPLSMTKRCALLDLPRSMFYHTPQPVSGESYRLKGKMQQALCQLILPAGPC
jgi:hypothetical protein